MAPQRPRHKGDDDIDDFMASIFGNEPSQKPSKPLFARPQKQQRPALRLAPQPTPTQQRQPTAAHKPLQPAKERPHQAPSRKQSNRKQALGKPLLGIVIAVTFIGIVFVLWQGPLQTLIYPSPFSQETHQKMEGIALYYPTSLPDGYKIEKDTMKFPSSGVLVFAASTESGTIVTFSLQAKPSGLNTKPFTDKLIDTKSVSTDEGEAVIGEDTDGKRIASYVTDQTWVLVTANGDQLTSEQLETIVRSFRKG